jgi:fumarylacetoacetate (FAA) hydrolase
VVVNRALTAWTKATHVAPTLQAALDAWPTCEPKLRTLSAALEAGAVVSEPFVPKNLLAPLPRAFEWVDGSAYINHVLLVRRARKAEPPETLQTDPLVYQGGSGVMLGPTEEIVVADARWGCDFEAEVAVVLGDTPQGTTAAEAGDFVRLVMVANDVTLRNLVPAELAKGFGFFQSKPATAFSPVAVTPDELGEAWRDGRVHLTVKTWHNGRQVGDTHAGPEMHFSFFQLVEHLAKTRSFTAGTILGSGTVSNADRARGYSCIAEQRALETIDAGAPITPFLADGDRVEIELCSAQGPVCGRIDQRVRVLGRP